MIQRVAFVCALALIVLPFTLAAQSTPAYQEDQNDVKQPVAEPNSMQNRGVQERGVQENDSIRSDVDRSNTDLDQDETTPGELPATAGELPLLGLIGALSLAAAAGTRFATRTK